MLGPGKAAVNSRVTLKSTFQYRKDRKWLGFSVVVVVYCYCFASFKEISGRRTVAIIL